MEWKSILIQAFRSLHSSFENLCQLAKKVAMRSKKRLHHLRIAIMNRISSFAKRVAQLIKRADLSALREFFLFILAYGFLINYVLKVLFSFPFSIETIPAWGIAYYFIREEFVRIIRRIKGR